MAATLCDPSFAVLPDAVRPVSRPVAQRFVRAHHYLHRAPPGDRARLGVFAGGRMVGVLVFGRPVARLEDQETTLELLRMVLFDGPKNSESRTLSLAERWIRAEMPGVRRLIAYADSERHRGTIYRAANWTEVPCAVHENGGWANRRGRTSATGGRKMKFERVVR